MSLNPIAFYNCIISRTFDYQRFRTSQSFHGTWHFRDGELESPYLAEHSTHGQGADMLRRRIE